MKLTLIKGQFLFYKAMLVNIVDEFDLDSLLYDHKNVGQNWFIPALPRLSTKTAKIDNIL